MISSYLEVTKSLKSGRGVFAKQNIRKGVVIEISPVIEISVKDRKILEKTILGNYIFEWGENHKKAALGIGYVSMYNHDYSSNCEYQMDFEKQVIEIKTVRNIKKGEELSINYNADPESKVKVWFDKS